MKVFYFLILFLIGFVQVSSSEQISFAEDTVLLTDIIIKDGQTLLIQPGVTVRFEGYYGLIVRGNLIAKGESDKPILFTGSEYSNKHRKNSWRGIEISGAAANANLKHCIIEGAYRNVVWGADPVIDSCVFRENHYGIYSTRNATPHIKTSIFESNIFGIAADFASPLIFDNKIAKNNVGLHFQMSSAAMVGRNTFQDNIINIQSDESLGKNKDAVSMQYIWDTVLQMF